MISLYTPTEEAFLHDYFGIDRPERLQTIDIYLAPKNGICVTQDALEERLWIPHAVAQLLLGAIQDRLPQWSCFREENIKGARAVALAILLARRGERKESIRHRISGMFDYNLDRSIDEIRHSYEFEISCQKSVPESIIAFLDSVSWEDAVRNAISLGGDSDTLACITGGIAEAYYGKTPDKVRRWAMDVLPIELRQGLHLSDTMH